jgi:hypothetical protein
MVATLGKLTEESKRLAAAAALPDASSNKKKRAKEIAKLQRRVQQALDEQRIEDDVKDVKLERVFSPCSTKQVMIARVCFVVRFSLDLALISVVCEAPARASDPPKPVVIFWLRNRIQELLPHRLPGNTRSNTIYNLRSTVYKASITHLSSSVRYILYPQRISRPIRTLIFHRCRPLKLTIYSRPISPVRSCMSLRQPFLWTLRLLPAETWIRTARGHSTAFARSAQDPQTAKDHSSSDVHLRDLRGTWACERLKLR